MLSNMSLRVFLAAAVCAGALAQTGGGGSQVEPGSVSACYQCKSVIDKNCADTDDILKQTPTPCSQMELNGETLNAVGCRKTLQYVEATEEEERVIRECAYAGENVDGQKRTGNKGVQIYYYQCDDKDGCNGAATSTAAAMAVFAGIALARLV